MLKASSEDFIVIDSNIEGPETSVNIWTLLDSVFHSQKPKILVDPALRGFDHYNEDDIPDDDGFRKEWMDGYREAQSVTGLSFSNANLEHLITVCRPMGMQNTILIFLKRYTVLDNIVTRRKFCPVSMAACKKVYYM